MAKAYTLIQAQTLTSSAASVTFSNIPQNYTDLIIKVSARTTRSDYAFGSHFITFNGSSASNYSYRYARGDGTNATSVNAASVAYILELYTMPSSTGTASTFGNTELCIPNYTSGYNKSCSMDGVSEYNSATSNLILTTGYWAQTAAITSVTFTEANSNSYVAGSTFYLYGIGGTRATGGTITADTNYTYHTFTSTSTFTALEKIKNAESLVVAGGGGSGGYLSGGGTGGGAGGGGVAYTNAITLNAGNTYVAVIGAGGSAGTSTANGTNGANSNFNLVTAYGGGYGASHFSGNAAGGGVGGSGGGASEWAGTHPGGTANQTTSGNIVGYGYPGGAANGTSITSGGGGGAGQAGQDGGSNYNGFGGVGTSVFTSWLSTTQTGVNINGTYFIAGGGGAGGNNTYNTGGFGGAGGGGAGTYTATGTAGTANTGGGAGGGHGTGAAGGSGLVIIRYPNT